MGSADERCCPERRGDQTEQTRVFDIVRSAPREDELAADQPGQEKAYLATAADNFATRVVWAGEGVDLVRDIPTASAIIERIIAQAVTTLTEGAKLIRY
jgi:nitronate monooxygenase